MNSEISSRARSSVPNHSIETVCWRQTRVESVANELLCSRRRGLSPRSSEMVKKWGLWIKKCSRSILYHFLTRPDNFKVFFLSRVMVSVKMIKWSNRGPDMPRVCRSEVLACKSPIGVHSSRVFSKFHHFLCYHLNHVQTRILTGILKLQKSHHCRFFAFFSIGLKIIRILYQNHMEKYLQKCGRHPSPRLSHRWWL